MKAKRDEVKAGVWAERIAAFERSDVSRRAWCAQNGVNKNTLDYWRKRLSAALPAVAPIRVTMRPAGEASVAVSAIVRIDLPHGVRVHTAADIDTAWLAALVRGIAGC